MLEKLVSLMLVPLTLFYTMLPFFLGNRSKESFADPVPENLHSVRAYVAFVEEHGAPSYATSVFVRQIEPLYELLRTLGGRPRADEENKHLNAHIDETLSELCGYIAENSGIDVELLITTLPNLNKPAELVNQVVRPDTAELRGQIFALRDRAYDEGQTLLGYLLYLLGIYLSIIREVSIYTVPYEEAPDTVEVMMDVVYDDGERAVVHPGILINTQTGEVRGWTDKGMVDLGFDVNIYDLLIYGTVHCWQRELGFNLLYDLLADTTPLYNLETRRIKFVYGGKVWMIQVWKGNYGLASNGVEVGVYNRPIAGAPTVFHAAADDEMMPLSAKLYHGDELLLEKGPETHWWLSAFKLSPVIYLPESLTMTFSITFPDRKMLRAFTAAVKLHGAHDISCTVDGLTAACVF